MVSLSPQHIRENFRSKSTEELLEIWETNDRDTWSDEVFEIVKEILAERKEDLPDQRDKEPVQTAATLFGNSELDNYLVNASGTSFLTMNILALFGSVIFGWLIAVVYNSLGKGKFGWNFVLLLMMFTVAGSRLDNVFVYIGFAVYIVAWVHVNILFFRYRKLGKQRLAEIDKQGGLDTNTIMEKGLILDKVMRDKQSSLEVLRTAYGRQDGNPVLLVASAQRLIKSTHYHEALDFLNRVPTDNIDKPLLQKVNRGLKIINKKM